MSCPKQIPEESYRMEFSSEQANYVREDFTVIEQWIQDSTACPEQIEELVQRIQQLDKDNRTSVRLVKRYAQEVAQVKAHLAKIECENCDTVAALSERCKQSEDTLENARQLHADQVERMKADHEEENGQLKEKIRRLREELSDIQS